MKHFLLLLFLAFGATVDFAASWHQVAALNISGCNGCLTTLAVSPSGNTVVAGYSSQVLLYEKPATGWTNTFNPTTLLTCSDSDVFAIAGITYGVASNDTTIIAEATKHVGTENKEIEVLLVWQEPPNGWGSQSSISQSFELTTGTEAATNNSGPFWNSVALSDYTIAVGDRSESNLHGAVWVWNNPPNTAAPVAKLTASDGLSYDQLGYTLSISDNTITSGTCPLFGLHSAVYVFVQPAGGWISSTQTAELKYSADTKIGLGCFVASNSDTIASGVPSYDNDEGRIDIFAKPASGWSDSSSPNAQFTSSPNTGAFFGLTVHFATIDGNAMLVAGSPYLNANEAAENIYYEPSSGWNSDQQPNETLELADPEHFDFNGIDGAGANTVVFPNCNYDSGCGSPIYVFQYQ